MDKLKEFYNDKEMMKQVEAHFIDYLNRQAVQKVYERKDTTAVPEAREAIEGALAELKEKFELKKSIEPKNNAR